MAPPAGVDLREALHEIGTAGTRRAQAPIGGGARGTLRVEVDVEARDECARQSGSLGRGKAIAEPGIAPTGVEPQGLKSPPQTQAVGNRLARIACEVA